MPHGSPDRHTSLQIFTFPPSLLEKSPVPEHMPLATRFRAVFDRAKRIAEKQGFPEAPQEPELRTTLGTTDEEKAFVRQCKARGKISEVLATLLEAEVSK